MYPKLGINLTFMIRNLTNNDTATLMLLGILFIIVLIDRVFSIQKNYKNGQMLSGLGLYFVLSIPFGLLIALIKGLYSPEIFLCWYKILVPLGIVMTYFFYNYLCFSMFNHLYLSAHHQGDSVHLQNLARILMIPLLMVYAMGILYVKVDPMLGLKLGFAGFIILKIYQFVKIYSLVTITNLLSPLYIILYFCCFEILPSLVALKLIYLW
ncbi:MAG: hypothetical protein C4K58_00670 [Flavobacteriaceae bacterium]|nr:MAG: hypothetical protein C4K58_00670 [Flavobacteriaceae bacterium]